MGGRDGMTPHLNGEVYWQPWNSSVGKTGRVRGRGPFDLRFSCIEASGEEASSGNLKCKSGNWGKETRVLQNFFGRVAYHLFFSTNKPNVRTTEDVFRGGWLIS